MLRLDLRLAAASDWMRVFDSRDGTLFVAVAKVPDVSTPVRVDVIVGKDGPRVILHGSVISKKDGATPGAVVAISANERVKINYLHGYVRGGLLDLRETRRLPIRLPVTYGAVDGPHKTFTRDLNEEGVFVVTDAPLPEESEVHLLLSFPGRAQPMSLSGVVSHTVVPEDEDIPGMGIVFQVTPDTNTDLVKAVDEVEKAFLSDKLPEEYLQ